MASKEPTLLTAEHAREQRDTSREPNVPLHPIGALPKTSLQQAARDGREDIVRQHLARLPKAKKGNVLNKKDAEGHTALHYAAKFNRFKILQLLITSGANPEITTTDEKLTPLHLAARYTPRIQSKEMEEREREDSSAEVTSASTSRRAVQLLLVYCRVDVNVKDIYGVSPLHVACSRGNLAALEELIKAPNIQLDICDNNEDTPLHEACLLGDGDIVETLLNAMKNSGHDLLTYLLALNNERETPLHLACKEGLPSIVNSLLRVGFEHKRDLVRAQDNVYNIPLHLACESGKEEIVRVLLLNGADIEAVREDDITPLHIAARQGFVGVVAILLNKSNDIINCVDRRQQTPLHFAAQHDQCDMVEHLLQQGADIGALDEDSRAPLLVAAAYGKTKVLKLLIDQGAPMDSQDKNGKSVVFIAAEQNHPAVLQELLSNPIGQKLTRAVDTAHNTPLHIATKRGNIGAVRLLLRASVKVDARNELSKTPIHLAAENGHSIVVRELIRFQSDTAQDEDEDSNSPLHLACINGHLAVARVLINANCDVEARNVILWTPMDCAAAGGYHEVVSLLINSGADVDPTDRSKVTPLHLASREGHLKLDGNNALDLAIENGHESIALEIIRSPRWESALRNTTMAQWGGFTTPLRKLIRKMPEVAEEVFNKCTVTNATKDGTIRADSRDFRVFFNYEFLEDFRDPEARATALARKLSHYRQSYTHQVSIDDDTDEASEITSDPSTEDVEDSHGDIIARLQTRKGHNFTTSWGPQPFKKSRHPLSLMVDSARIDLLKHPLVTSLLHYKWQTYGRYFYFGNLFFYCFFLTFLTAFALLTPNPESETCKAVLNDRFGAFNGSSGMLPTATTEQRNILQGECDSVLSPTREGFLIVAAIIVLISSLIRLFMELLQLIQLKVLYYFISWVNWLEVVLFCSSIAFVFTFFTECLCPYRGQWSVGAVAVFLGWIGLILLIRKLPLTGIYVVMFVDIFYTFCRLFFLSFLLVIAFGLSFYMAFNDPSIDRTPFTTPGLSLLKTITMTTGEFEFDGIFRQAAGGVGADEVDRLGGIAFPTISYVLWVVFIILMPILLTNLLVGLAVDDIKGILEAAVLKRLALQVELALSIEEVFPRRIRRWFIVGTLESSPNRNFSLWEKFRYSAWGGERFDSSETISNALHPPLTPIDQVQQHTNTLLTEVDALKQAVIALTERNQSLEQMMKAFLSHQGILMESEDGANISLPFDSRSRTSPHRSPSHSPFDSRSRSPSRPHDEFSQI